MKPTTKIFLSVGIIGGALVLSLLLRGKTGFLSSSFFSSETTSSYTTDYNSDTVQDTGVPSTTYSTSTTEYPLYTTHVYPLETTSLPQTTEPSGTSGGQACFLCVYNTDDPVLKQECDKARSVAKEQGKRAFSMPIKEYLMGILTGGLKQQLCGCETLEVKLDRHGSPGDEGLTFREAENIVSVAPTCPNINIEDYRCSGFDNVNDALVHANNLSRNLAQQGYTGNVTITGAQTINFVPDPQTKLDRALLRMRWAMRGKFVGNLPQYTVLDCSENTPITFIVCPSKKEDVKLGLYPCEDVGDISYPDRDDNASTTILCGSEDRTNEGELLKANQKCTYLSDKRGGYYNNDPSQGEIPPEECKQFNQECPYYMCAWGEPELVCSQPSQTTEPSPTTQPEPTTRPLETTMSCEALGVRKVEADYTITTTTTNILGVKRTQHCVNSSSVTISVSDLDPSSPIHAKINTFFQNLFAGDKFCSDDAASLGEEIHSLTQEFETPEMICSETLEEACTELGNESLVQFCAAEAPVNAVDDPAMKASQANLQQQTINLLIKFRELANCGVDDAIQNNFDFFQNNGLDAAIQDAKSKSDNLALTILTLIKAANPNLAGTLAGAQLFQEAMKYLDLALKKYPTSQSLIQIKTGTINKMNGTLIRGKLNIGMACFKVSEKYQAANLVKNTIIPQLPNIGTPNFKL